jgi:hypothetical protein
MAWLSKSVQAVAGRLRPGASELVPAERGGRAAGPFSNDVKLLPILVSCLLLILSVGPTYVKEN